MPADTARSPIKILVVDAERAFHEVATAAVHAVRGVEMLCVTQPAEALNKLDQFMPTLMIVDGQLYGAAGINFVKRVRLKQTPAPEGTLVLFAAREFTGGLSGRLCDTGFHGIVRKPISAKNLAVAIQKILTQPVPFVLGGAYLGPDRRAEQQAEGYEPERRRAAARGGWTGTPPLFYRPDSSKSAAAPARPPAWKRPPPGTPARPTSGAGVGAPAAVKPAAGSGGIEGADISVPPKRSGGGPLVDEPLPAAASAASEPLVEASPAKPKRATSEPLIDAPAAKPKRSAGEPLVDAPAPARPKVRVVEEEVVAAPPPEVPGFDLAGAVERHRQWLGSNGVNGAKADLSGIKLPGAQLANQNLTKAGFRQTDLTNADLTMCVLLDADMRNAILSQAVLNQAQLSGAKLRHADLQFAQMVECGLQASDLAGANLRGAVLTGADLRGANLLGTNICGADFTSVVNLTQKQLDRATGDAKTVLPAGLFVGRGDT